MIRIDYRSGRSLHEQIAEALKERMIAGVLAPHEKLPSVRELSVSLTVNPNTVQKAYKELENEGFIYSVPGKGNFVTPMEDARDRKKIKELYDSVGALLRELRYLGETEENIQGEILRILKEGNHD